MLDVNVTKDVKIKQLISCPNTKSVYRIQPQYLIKTQNKSLQLIKKQARINHT